MTCCRMRSQRAADRLSPENAPATRTDCQDFSFRRRAARPARRRRRSAVNRAIELCFLESVLYQTIDTLSRATNPHVPRPIADHDPDVLILDEPPTGLDPNQKHEVRNLIKRWARTRRSCSHPHPGGSGSRLLAGNHHRPRTHRRQRHAGGAEGTLGDRGCGAGPCTRNGGRNVVRTAGAGSRCSACRDSSPER